LDFIFFQFKKIGMKNTEENAGEELERAPT
jgi:hypothetical protein